MVRRIAKASASPVAQGVHSVPTVVGALEGRTLLSTLTVTNDNDSGSGSLRGALAAAVAGDTIKFARSAYGTITLATGPLRVTSSVTIDGPGAKDVTISGNNTFQDLVVDADVSATVSGLTFTGGQGPATYPYGGGGIFNDGTLTVADSVITNNSGEVGGGILNGGSMTVADSVITNNAGSEAGGGILNNGSLTVQGSVVSNYTASFAAGIANNPTAVLDLSGSTIENNTAGDLNGGIGNFLGTVKITSSVVSGNAAPSGGGDGGQGIGGGLYIASGSATTLTGKTVVVLNFATTSNNDIYGTYST